MKILVGSRLEGDDHTRKNFRPRLAEIQSLRCTQNLAYFLFNQLRLTALKIMAL
jgi:hypothetical protein